MPPCAVAASAEGGGTKSIVARASRRKASTRLGVSRILWQRKSGARLSANTALARARKVAIEMKKKEDAKKL